MHTTSPNVIPKIYDVHLLHNVHADVKIVDKWLYNEKHHRLPKVGVGARAMITENLDISRGLANSATCTITDVKEDNKGVIMWVEAELHSTNKKATFSRTVIRNNYHGKYRFTKKSFALTLAYALTAHKCQGGTITGPGIIDIKNAFAPGMLYVMLSRFQSRKQIKILRKLTPKDFQPVPIE
jgi:hypothetical protein